MPLWLIKARRKIIQEQLRQFSVEADSADEADKTAKSQVWDNSDWKTDTDQLPVVVQQIVEEVEILADGTEEITQNSFD